MLSTTDDLRAMERLIAGLSPEKRKALQERLEPTIKAQPWIPLPGQQAAAYTSPADMLLFGGQAGPGKSDLLVGLACTQHEKSVIFRRQSKDLRGIEARIIEIMGSGSYNLGDQLYNDGKRLIELGHLEKPGSEYGWQGRPHDFIGFDEGAQIDEGKISFVTGWLRSTKPGQRCRIVIASNPPLSSEGEWLITWFAPWLDPSFPDPAKPGELRWCIRDADGSFRWVDGPGEHRRTDGQTATAQSRSFIPASLDDNPFLADTNYRTTLENLPPVMREAMLRGNFMAARKDDDWQVVPTEWIREAQGRWAPDGCRGLRMTALGVDVAQGGDDETTIAHRYGAWYGPLTVRPGAETPDPPSVAGLTITVRRDGASVVVDVGGGYGGGVVSYLKDNGFSVTGFNAANSSTKRTADGQLAFVNRRAEAWWRFREALDPSQEGGSPLALPMDPVLLGDLTAPRWKLTPRGIQIESKDDIRKRLGRSTDRGDAVVMAWSEGQSLAEKKMRSMTGRPPQVQRGYAKQKAHHR